MVTREEYTTNMDKYIQNLKHAEKSDNTISNYKVGLNTFLDYADSQNWEQEEALKDGILDYKKYLESRYKIPTINSYIISLNGYLKYLDKQDLCLKTVKTQEQQNNLENSFSMDEYLNMSNIAYNRKNKDTYFILTALVSTGIRISELRFMTVESLKTRGLSINNKGKVRFVPMSEKLCSTLLEYCKAKGIQSGYVFFGRNPQEPIDRRTVSKRIKKVASLAGIDEIKAHPHSLRHLFAKRFMEVVGNVTALKNILGHSSLKSTMIYTVTTNDEKRKDMDKLGFY